MNMTWDLKLSMIFVERRSSTNHMVVNGLLSFPCDIRIAHKTWGNIYWTHIYGFWVSTWLLLMTVIFRGNGWGKRYQQTNLNCEGTCAPEQETEGVCPKSGFSCESVHETHIYRGQHPFWIFSPNSLNLDVLFKNIQIYDFKEKHPILMFLVFFWKTSKSDVFGTSGTLKL